MHIELVLLPVLSLLHTSFHFPVSCNKVIKVKLLDRLKTRIINTAYTIFIPKCIQVLSIFFYSQKPSSFNDCHEMISFKTTIVSKRGNNF